MRVGTGGVGGSTCPIPRLTECDRCVSWVDGSGGRARENARLEGGWKAGCQDPRYRG